MAGLSKTVTRRINALGFTGPHIVDLAAFGDQAGQGLREFLGQDYHGTMDWLAETETRRAHPANMWPEARSAIVLGMNYGPDADPLVSLENQSNATISVYAQNRDYHDLIKGRLKEIAGIIAKDTGQDVKVFVDTAPLMEKPLAMAGGLGWQGKHTNLVSREFGSWLFLGVILSAQKLDATQPEIDHCGSCRACMDICPTDAFPSAYKLDARKCISYLTIEHKGAIDIALRGKMGNRIYGCDDCLAICPWNKYASVSREVKLKARDDLQSPSLAELSKLDDKAFRKKFSGSPIKRIGRDQFIRNVIYAIGNSGDAALKPYLTTHLKSSNPIIAEAANWAMEKLGE